MGIVRKIWDNLTGKRSKVRGAGPTKAEQKPNVRIASEVVAASKPVKTPRSMAYPDGKAHEAPPQGKRTTPLAKPSRDPYFIQVGLDFGTSYSKCVCRDNIINKAWIYVPDAPVDAEYPFLLPSALQIKSGSLILGSPQNHYHDQGLPHVKVALVKVALEEWDDPALAPFRAAHEFNKMEELKDFVAGCAIYLLGGILGNVRVDIRKRFAGFGEQPEDRMAVTLAIPVADAEKPQINDLFQIVLDSAYQLADKLAGHPKMKISSVSKLVSSTKRTEGMIEASEDYTCYIYPEVSAGVQGFVRSRVSKEGIYCFSETGAATVDQSVFIFRKPKGGDALLNYLHASVHFLGSSTIEHVAADSNGNRSPGELERWRNLKERGQKSDELDRARYRVGVALTKESLATLFIARRKLPVIEQFGDIRLLFGGGGHTRNPYECSVLEAFKDPRLYKRTHNPPVVGMPIPKDLEPADVAKKSMNRLCIAYGLSFPPWDFPNHKYPRENPVAQPVSPKVLASAIGKEQC